MYKKWGLRVLKKWPPYSADLNPQENVWGWAEPELRRAEANSDTLVTFKNPRPNLMSYFVMSARGCCQELDFHGHGVSPRP